jgi:CYTH domain-containing protein
MSFGIERKFLVRGDDWRVPYLICRFSFWITAA